MLKCSVEAFGRCVHDVVECLLFGPYVSFGRGHGTEVVVGENEV